MYKYLISDVLTIFKILKIIKTKLVFICITINIKNPKNKIIWKHLWRN